MSALAAISVMRNEGWLSEVGSLRACAYTARALMKRSVSIPDSTRSNATAFPAPRSVAERARWRSLFGRAQSRRPRLDARACQTPCSPPPYDTFSNPYLFWVLHNHLTI
jgi:hypothetical protein